MKVELMSNKRFLKIIEATKEEYNQLKLALTHKINNWRFHPLVKKAVWNGEISFIKNNLIPSGLWLETYNILNKYNFKYEIEGIKELFDLKINKENFNEWVKIFFDGYKKYPRDYQIETAYKILKYRRCLAELATSAGKSLIMFMIIAYLLQKNIIKKILLIVPNVSLVGQLFEDFIEYNHKNELKINIQQIYAGKKLNDNSNIVIGTYQSLTKMESEFFTDYDMVIIDETHKGNNNSVKNVLNNLWHAEYRIGLSGTIPKQDKNIVEYLTLVSNTGPIITEINADFLMQNNYIAPLKISIFILNYATDEQKKSFYDLRNITTLDEKTDVFALENNFVINNEKRFNFIIEIISKITKNTMILFHRIEYGMKIYNTLRDKLQNPVYYVDGEINTNIRKEYIEKMEEISDIPKILVSSFGTFGTGINITNLYNIFLVESFKSDSIIRQSIGRGLRLHENKEILNVIDFVDDLRYKNTNYTNYLYEHGLERQNIYLTQNFNFKIININI